MSFPPRAAYNVQNLRNKTLATPDHERVNISKFADMGMD